jgi:hypothetical protein
MSLLKDYIEWARKQMQREETPVVVEPQQVQPVTVIEEKPVRKPRKKKTVE